MQVADHLLAVDVSAEKPQSVLPPASRTDPYGDDSFLMVHASTRDALGEADPDVESGRQPRADRPKSPTRLSCRGIT